MTQRSARAASPLPGASLGSRLPKRPWPVRLVLVAALLLAVPFLFDAGTTVHAADNEITGVTLTSPEPGELAITWNAPSRAPSDYRVTWKKSDGKWPSYMDDNTVEGGNAFPTGTSHTVSDLEEGTEYSVRVRARYHNSEGNVEESGPWSDPPEEITVASTPSKDGEGDSNEGRSTNPPAKPQDLLAAATHSSVLLIWTDLGDDSITGYQILRGPDAANLAVLTNDTGNANTSYTDDTVTAETTYVYAILARNANGLNPQSDAAPANTPAAPVEPEIALAVAGADFTLDGQDLDTSGACSESDIDSISDAYTINIETKSPVFAVDGTLDSDDRIGLKVGRDKAAVDAASESANENDLRGTNQTVTLTFPEGRNLLRVWGDEDETGGGEEHFFRVNVVPYWEWNGNILSKDSDCRDTTANAPAVGEITDDDCIVTAAFGNTAELRFFNVINEHFNVYVYVNGVEVINEPSTTDLGSSFTVNLDAGDNLIRIRLAAKGSQPLAEVYDSDSFYYKVTGTDALVSNLGKTSQTATTSFSTLSHLAMQFTTGSNPGGYTVSKVRLPIAIESSGVTPVVSIYSDVSGDPGASIKTLTNPATITVSSTETTEVEFDAGDYKLDAGTYWIVIEKPAGSDQIYVETTLDTSEDAGGAPGWSIGNANKFSTDAGVTFSTNPRSLSLQFAVKGALSTEDTTPPELVSATVATSGTSIDLIFNEVYDLPATEGPANTYLTTLLPHFRITADGVNVPLSFHLASQNPSNKRITWDFASSKVRQGQSVVVTYTDPTASDDTVAIQDASGNDVQTFTTGVDGVPAVVNGSTVAKSAPGSPTSLEATAGGSGQINLTWIAPSDNGGTPITGYKIEVSDDAGTTWTDQVASTGDQLTAYSHTGLGDTTTRHYRVSAINTLGTSSPSNVDSATTPEGFLVSNANSIVDQGTLCTSADGTGSNKRAIQFTTGDNPSGYKIDTVQLTITETGGSVPLFSIYSDSSGTPGSSLKILTNPGTLPTSYALADFDAEQYPLNHNTSYWIVLEKASTTGKVFYRTTESTAEDAGTATGWSIGNDLYELNSGTWTNIANFRYIPQLTIKGEPAKPAITLASDLNSIIRELH